MDNQERRNVSWWYSRHGERSRDWSGVKRSRRITFIDMLLLAVTAGIILPRLLQFSAAAQPAAQPASQPAAQPASQPPARESEHRTLGSLQVQTAENHRGGTLTLTADFSLPPEPIPPEHTPTTVDRAVDTPLERAADTAVDTPADIGITIYDHTHKPLDSVFDLPPAPGRSRQLTVSAPSSAAAYCILSSGRRQIRIELTPEDD